MVVRKNGNRPPPLRLEERERRKRAEERKIYAGPEKLCRSCNEMKAESTFVAPFDICADCTYPIGQVAGTEEEYEKFCHQAREKGLGSIPGIDGQVPEEKAKEITKSEAARRLLASRTLQRRRLLPFIKASESGYMPGWVHKDICQRLEQFSADVIAGKSPRLMLFLPPRAGKSVIASVNFPAWHLGNNPDHEIIACSYASDLAEAFSRKVRAKLREKEYQQVFPKTKLDPSSQSAGAWLTTQGGGYVAAGVNGAITGKGAHILIIDDPVKNRIEAESETNQKNTKDWYTSTAYTRLAPGGGVLVILTRWHDMDLAGQLQEDEAKGGDAWEIVEYPAIALEDERFRKKGEALHPERYDEKAFAQIRRAVGERDWWSLYQQKPVADDGEYFKRDKLLMFDDDDIRHQDLVFYQAWDFAIGKNERNDYSVGMCVGIDMYDNIYVVDAVRGKFAGDEIVEQMLDFYERWQPDTVGAERGQIEMAIEPFMNKRIQERRLYAMHIQKLSTGRRDKELRARSIQGRINQGKVFFRREAEFTKDLTNEMLRFPNGKHDDQVDALAWLGVMMDEFVAKGRPPPPKKKSWKDRLNTLGVRKSKYSAMSA